MKRLIFTKGCRITSCFLSLLVIFFYACKVSAGVDPKIHQQEDGKATKTCEKKKSSHWHGSKIQFGMNITTGNTDASELNGTLKLNYTNFPWQNIFKFETRQGRANGLLNRERYAVSNQARYAFNKSKTQFGFFNVDWVDDAFSPYEYQTVIAVGYGRNLYDTKHFLWRVEAGPGFRYDEVKGATTVQKHWVGIAKTKIEWKIKTYLHFKQTARIDVGEPFDYIQSKTALVSKINTHWSLQITYEIEHFSKIPKFSGNTIKTDTVTTASIVYDF